MPRLTKTVVYVLLALVLVWLGGCLIRREGPAYAKWKLKRQVQRIEPWTASTNYSVAGWKQLVTTAKAFQKARPELAQGALAEFLQQRAGDPAQSSVAKGKVFLLLRFLFELPEGAKSGQANAPSRLEPGRSGPRNEDGTVNLAWPLLWNQGNPRLVAGWDDKLAEGKSLPDEYVLLRYRFRYRDLSGVRVDK